MSAIAVAAPAAHAQSAVKLRGAGTLQIADGTSNIVLAGTASHLGNYLCFGEVEFSRGRGSLTGEGVAMFTAANGDVLVGVMTCTLNDDGTGQFAVSWRDSVAFSDGSVVASSGRFARSRPSGILIGLAFRGGENGIIAILIG
jgi:hypothetical protein